MYENIISILSSIIKLRVVNSPIPCEFIPEVQSSFFFKEVTIAQVDSL